MKNNFGCVIMASGMARRFGSNKLLASFHGTPLVTHIMDTTDGIFERRVIVTRHEAVARLAKERGIDVILHDLPDRSDTVRLGIEVMSDMRMCMFCPSDQPLLRRETISELVRYGESDDGFIYRTSFGGEMGAPVLFPKWTFGELANLPAGKGGVVVAKKYSDRVKTVEVGEKVELLDADTPEMLAYLEQYGG